MVPALGPALVTGRQGIGDGLQGRYCTERTNHGAPACFSGLKSRFAGQVLHRKAELCCTCLGDGETGDRRWFAGQVLQKTTELWGTSLLFGTEEPVCRAGTAQNDRIVVYLP